MRYAWNAVLIAIAMFLSLDRSAQAAEGAVGGSIGYTFEVGKIPVSTRLRVYREFEVQNRMEGTAGYFTVSLPIAIDTNSQIASAKPIKTKF